jgi:hypothetical protein
MSTEIYTCPICAYVTEGKQVRQRRHCGSCHRVRIREAIDWMPTWILRLARLWGRLALLFPALRRDPEVRANLAVVDALISERMQTA